MTFLRSPETARRAAVVAAALLAAIAAFHVYWALGGGWALHAIGRVDPDSTTGGRIFYGAVALLAVAAAAELLILARVVAMRHVPTYRRLVWVLAAILLVGGSARTASAPAIGFAALVLALLFGEVAYASPREAKARRRR